MRSLCTPKEYGMEPEREVVEDLMERFGYTEQEARAAFHLGRAEDLLEEVFLDSALEGGGGRGVGKLVWMAYYGQHFGAIKGLLARKSAGRAYPEGWGSQARDPKPEESS